MELLLTGSTGFVGRNLLIKLHQDSRWESPVVLPVTFGNFLSVLNPTWLSMRLDCSSGGGARNILKPMLKVP
jgi:hypothetical protein